ncbi:MAG TPA: peptidylprolyl isomerase, partial [Cryomorphaceae bacterium]|nr:peptidylprolyl isomerase [Cryomorphaceae bacterium]
SSGREATVVGTAVGSPRGFQSGILDGLNGVYQFKVLNLIENAGLAPTASDVASQNNQLRTRVQSALFQSLIDAAEIEDNRGKFY